MTMTLVSFFLLLGAGFGFIAALGVVRMPDLYCRMHAATKAGAFGVAMLLIALAIALPTARTIIMCVLIISFFYLTAPIAAHMIGHVALSRNVPLWRPSSKTMAELQQQDKRQRADAANSQSKDATEEHIT